MNNGWYSDSHRGSPTKEAVCNARAAEYDRWCPTTGTIAEFVPGCAKFTKAECPPKRCRVGSGGGM
eukprot:TRINITY_DN146_c0_g1_i1.p1 TRINITY_DN146_c0_g1~~TRINITY_DN146_c0_g1_i1.p1  ORF type:complete len:66 (+),score=9.25 TRINITY_DN146_c0_g1_i1:212-409(+)